MRWKFWKKPKITLEYMPANEENQTVEIKCFRDGLYSHSVTMRYFTTEQVDRLTKSKQQLLNK